MPESALPRPRRARVAGGVEAAPGDDVLDLVAQRLGSAAEGITRLGHLAERLGEEGAALARVDRRNDPASSGDDAVGDAVHRRGLDPVGDVGGERLVELRPDLREDADEGGQQDEFGPTGLRQPPRAVERRHGLPGPWAPADARRPGRLGLHDAPLARMEVEHPVLNRPRKHGAHLPVAECGHPRSGVAVGDPLGDLVLVEQKVVHRRGAAALVQPEYRAGIVPGRRQHLGGFGVRLPLRELFCELDPRAEGADEGDVVGRRAEHCELGVGERGERILPFTPSGGSGLHSAMHGIGRLRQGRSPRVRGHHPHACAAPDDQVAVEAPEVVVGVVVAAHDLRHHDLVACGEKEHSERRDFEPPPAVAAAP